MTRISAIAFLLAAATAAPASAEVGDQPEVVDDEPPLPMGLDDGGEEEPALPAGLDGPTIEESAGTSQAGFRLPFEMRGYLDLRGGARVQEDPHERRLSLAESRLQVDLERSFTPMALTLRVVADFVYDPVLDEYEPALESGGGAVDLRQANAVISPFELADLKVGRQILTWGTGDLLFINDLFPKDWTALVIGRADQYLKAPSDAVKASLFSSWLNADLVYAPAFDSDRPLDRRRLSSWDPTLGRLAGRDAPLAIDRPDSWFRDHEFAARLHRRLAAYELALYGYRGLWKAPAGIDPASGSFTFPKLSAYGASARGPLLGGIGNLEAGYYDSRLDRDGDDPTVRNSEWRTLAGLEREVVKNMTASGQYYVEMMTDHAAYRASQPVGAPIADRFRHVVTGRLTWLAQAARLRTSVFVAYSPSDADALARGSVAYQIDDHWGAELGANLFLGAEDHTFFGQLERNSNLYSSVRYGF